MNPEQISYILTELEGRKQVQTHLYEGYVKEEMWSLVDDIQSDLDMINSIIEVLTK